MQTRLRFVRGRDELDGLLRRAKLIRCRHCGRTGTLIGHGELRGYDTRSTERIVRGRRLFCSNRYRRQGCGRTFSVLLPERLRGFVVPTTIIACFVAGVVEGLSRKAAWLVAAGRSLSPSSGYRLWRRFSDEQSRLRARLLRECHPPPSGDADPLAQLMAHFDLVFPSASCLFSSFQRCFQLHLLG
jgi:hypothetical protein